MDVSFKECGGTPNKTAQNSSAQPRLHSLDASQDMMYSHEVDTAHQAIAQWYKNEAVDFTTNTYSKGFDCFWGLCFEGAACWGIFRGPENH